MIRRAATVGLAAGVAALVPLRAAAIDRIYHFVDENGVSHFSNVPADARYQPIGPMGGSSPPVSANASSPGATSVVPLRRVPAAEPAPEIEELPSLDPVEGEPGAIDAEDMEPDADES
jgi:hypothetical protein